MQNKRKNSAERDKDYRPQRYYRKGKKLISQSLGLKKKKNVIKWTQLENAKFLEFIKVNIQLLSNPKRRKQEKVFLQISKVVKTRSSDQCRSHHQKMIKHHGDLMGVIQNLESRLPKLLFQNRFTQNLSFGQEIQVLWQEQNQQFIFKEQIQIPELISKVEDKQIWEVILDKIWVNN